MKVHNVVQGTPEWLALRTKYFTASEAAAMMGCDPYGKTRNQLLAEKYSGVAPDVSRFVEERIFSKGHAVEAAFLPIAEDIIGDDLFPCVGTLNVEGLPLLASFDGLTMDHCTGYEHKLWNSDIDNAIRATGEPPHGYVWQLEHQLLVSGANEILFVTSDGQECNATHIAYTSRESRRAQLIAGWKQFQADLASYTKAVDTPKPTGTAPSTLPALHIEVTGMVTASNLAEFKATAFTAIRSVNRNLMTDQDFADAEASVKWCAEVEDRLKSAKEHALSQTASIDQLFKAIDDISAEARKVRLDLEKLVKARKEAIRDEIQEAAMNALKEQLAHENEAIPNRHAVPVQPEARTRIAAAMKGKKTVESLRNAADTCRAQLAIEVVLKINSRKEALKILHAAQAAAPELANLCHDERELVDLEPDHLKLVLDTRLSKHRAAEAARIEAEREQIRAEERAKAEQEARSEAEAAARQWADRVIETPVQTLMFAAASTAPEPQATIAPGPCRMLKLGELNDLIAPLEISTTGLVQLGFHPAATDRASKLYRADDLPKILSAMMRHISIAGAALTTHH